MAKKKKKLSILPRAANSLAMFYPEMAGQFLCPTCLHTYPISQLNSITEGHIIPRAAGGGCFAYICEGCNSTFGAKHDKWFGEYLRLLKLDGATILHIKPTLRRGEFKIDGVRVGGTYQITQERGLEFFINVDKTSPESLRQMMEGFVSNSFRGDIKGRTHTVSVPIPLLENQCLVDIGFLTSAYLMWFRELGYSWALQEHLNPIRDQIRNPTAAILPRNFFGFCRDQVFDRPWVGVGYVGEQLALLAGLANRIILLPPADTSEFYSTLGTDFGGLELDCRVLQFTEQHLFGGPVGVMFENRLVILPDIMMHSATAGYVLYFPVGGGGPYPLEPISQDEYGRRNQAQNAATIMLHPPLPRGETGRTLA